LDVVEDALQCMDDLNPEEWREFSFDLLTKELAELKGMQRLADAAIMECDRIIRGHEMSHEHALYERRLGDKIMLKERTARLQRLATQVQSLMKTP